MKKPLLPLEAYNTVVSDKKHAILCEEEAHNGLQCEKCGSELKDYNLAVTEIVCRGDLELEARQVRCTNPDCDFIGQRYLDN